MVHVHTDIDCLGLGHVFDYVQNLGQNLTKSDSIFLMSEYGKMKRKVAVNVGDVGTKHIGIIEGSTDIIHSFHWQLCRLQF
ncbi:hypothetical protein c7_L176 [Megavirus courdo7]|uniref:Uncharacterized protein n=1 Tax=Megavirus courdo7 TaxID=1128135 RepID=H2EA19_9VIRU|nr:hypothetical protein c7_L176 [Megavirus courdo7]